MKLKDWLRDFLKDKKQLGISTQMPQDAVHHVSRLIDAQQVFWEYGFTYTDRLVVRKGIIAPDGVTIAWQPWQTMHEVELS